MTETTAFFTFSTTLEISLFVFAAAVEVFVVVTLLSEACVVGVGV